jgi:hypothetical protein
MSKTIDTKPVENNITKLEEEYKTVDNKHRYDRRYYRKVLIFGNFIYFYMYFFLMHYYISRFDLSFLNNFKRNNGDI